MDSHPFIPSRRCPPTHRAPGHPLELLVTRPAGSAAARGAEREAEPQARTEGRWSATGGRAVGIWGFLHFYEHFWRFMANIGPILVI